MRKLLPIMILMLMIPIALAIEECINTLEPADVPCQITSTWPYPSPCSNWKAAVYNQSGHNVYNYTYQTHGDSGECYITWNITTKGSYTGIVQNDDTFNITILGDKKMMNFTVVVFMIIFNLGVFLFPVFVQKLTGHKATDYILKNLIFMGGILFLWLNVTLIRQMASDAGLGIDQLLQGVWWFVTLLVVIVIFAMVYVTTVGVMKMLQESQMRKRMGDDE